MLAGTTSKEPTVSRITSHLAIAAAALVAGGMGAAAFTSPGPERQATTLPARPLPPQVRTVVVTKTIHRVRHVRVHARRPAPVAAPPPAPVAVAARQVPVRSPVVVRRPLSIRPVPATHPLKTRTSGQGGGGEHEGDGEHEGGGDD
jgi:hypothetical protein